MSRVGHFLYFGCYFPTLTSHGVHFGCHVIDILHLTPCKCSSIWDSVLTSVFSKSPNPKWRTRVTIIGASNMNNLGVTCPIFGTSVFSKSQMEASCYHNWRFTKCFKKFKACTHVGNFLYFRFSSLFFPVSKKIQLLNFLVTFQVRLLFNLDSVCSLCHFFMVMFSLLQSSMVKCACFQVQRSFQ